MNIYKVIFHIDEMSKWNLLLANVNNLKKELNDSVLIEVLANSEAVKYFIQSNMDENSYSKVMRLVKQDVQFIVCNNSLKSNDINPESLIPNVKVVPSGVVELTLKQHDGYAYIKP